MNDKFCILLTSQNCGHCQHYRGDGILNSNQAYMHPEFLKKVIAPYKDIRLNFLNIHYHDMQNASNAGIKDISKTYMVGNNIFQEKFYPSEDRSKTYVDLRTFDDTTSKTKLEFSKREIIKDGKSVEWLGVVRDKISPMLPNYTYVFPGFLLVSRKNWQKTFDGKTQLLALLNIGWTVETENGEIMLEKNGDSLRERNENIFQMIDQYIVKKVEMKPHKSFKKDDEDKKAPSSDTPEVEKKKSVTFSDQVIQVSYDD
jgi:hypothetical protein